MTTILFYGGVLYTDSLGTLLEQSDNGGITETPLEKEIQKAYYLAPDVLATGAGCRFLIEYYIPRITRYFRWVDRFLISEKIPNPRAMVCILKIDRAYILKIRAHKLFKIPFTSRYFYVNTFESVTAWEDFSEGGAFLYTGSGESSIRERVEQFEKTALEGERLDPVYLMWWASVHDSGTDFRIQKYPLPQPGK